MSVRQIEYTFEALQLRMQNFFNSIKRAEEEIKCAKKNGKHFPEHVITKINMAFVKLYDICYDLAKNHDDDDYHLIYRVLSGTTCEQEIFDEYYQKYIKLLAEDV